MAEHCSLCERPSTPPSELCSTHHAALANLESAYAKWCDAFGAALTKEEYYSTLLKRDETGAAVKAVIKHLNEQGAR
jgi:predicted amidophosphoribosyltransferase